MLRGWLDTRDVDALASWAAGELQRSLPQPLSKTADADDVNERLARWERRLDRQLDAAPLAGPLNAFKKARLGAQLQLTLQESGYAKPLVRHCVKALLARVSR